MKKIFLKIFFLITAGIFAVIFLIGFKKNELFFFNQSKNVININDKLSESDFIEISDAPVSKLIQDKYGRIFYIKKRVVHNGHPISYFSFSPSKNKFGYFKNLDIYNENIPYNRQIILHIEDVITKNKKEVYHGSFKTSNWKWFSDNEVLVVYNCGTECEALYFINVNSDEKYILQYGVGYQWSPNKELVIAYYYTGAYGIAVGDKYGNEIFNLQREENKFFSKLVKETKGIWSSDSKKLALIIKKENQEKLELLVFDVENNFRIIYQKNLEKNNFSDFFGKIIK
ncbi:MAG: hypothetical protein ABH808_04170 [Candidatus Kuenenbacteria bacterium]